VHGVCTQIKMDSLSAVGAAAADKPKRMAMESALAYAALRDNDSIARIFLDESVRVQIASVDLVCLYQLMPRVVDLKGYAGDAELVRRMSQLLNNELSGSTSTLKQLQAKLSAL